MSGGRRSEILDTAASLFASAGLRTSLKDIADACDILPGSLYHHFDSKEAIVVEIVERYHRALDELANAAMAALVGFEPATAADLEARVVALGEEIAHCAVAHRAAILLTLYDPPSAAGDALVQIASRPSRSLEDAVAATLRAGLDRQLVRPDLDLEVFADRLCQVLLHVSLGVFGTAPGSGAVPAMRCRALLRGVAVRPPSAAALERSPAFAAAARTVEGWDALDEGWDHRLLQLRAAARAEFGRRGYEATTVRDIAAAAGLSTGSVYRLVGSKEELLSTIMSAFTTTAQDAWSAVLRTDADAVEKLAALLWVDINAVHRFRDEYNIQLAWLRESPPTSASLGDTFGARLGDVKRLLAQGVRSGRLVVEGPNADVRAWSMFELLWMPENIVDALGPRDAWHLATGTLLRGALVRGKVRPARRPT